MRLKNTSLYQDEDVRTWVMSALKNQSAKTVGLRVKVTGAREAYEMALAKEKRAKKLRQKWEAKVRYYERKAAKSP